MHAHAQMKQYRCLVHIIQYVCLCTTLLPLLLLLLSEQRLCCLLVAESLRAQVQTHIQTEKALFISMPF